MLSDGLNDFHLFIAFTCAAVLCFLGIMWRRMRDRALEEHLDVIEEQGKRIVDLHDVLVHTSMVVRVVDHCSEPTVRQILASFMINDWKTPAAKVLGIDSNKSGLYVDYGFKGYERARLDPNLPLAAHGLTPACKLFILPEDKFLTVGTNTSDHSDEEEDGEEEVADPDKED